MYDAKLPGGVLVFLDDAFPKDVSLAEAKEALPQYSDTSNTDWLWAVHALVSDRYIDPRGVIYADQFEHPVDAACLRLTPAGRQRAKECKEKALRRVSLPRVPSSEGETGTVFISCGQCTEEEKALGKAVCELVKKLTPFEPYFAEYQSNFEAVSRNILGALSRCAGFIGIMHPRGIVTTPSGPITRASVWVEQEIAIAAFIQEVMGRKLNVRLFLQHGIAREGVRDKLILNPVPFGSSEEVLADLTRELPAWEHQGESPSHEWIETHRERALAGLRSSRRSAFIEIVFTPVGRKPRREVNKLPEGVRCAELPDGQIHWPIVVVYTAPDHAPKLAVDGIFAEDKACVYRYWALGKNGDFYTLRSLVEDESVVSGLIEPREQMCRIAEALLFCKRLYSWFGVPDLVVRVSVFYGGIAGRVIGEDRTRPIHGPIHQDEVPLSADITVGQISLNTLPGLVKRLTENVFMLFGYTPSLERYKQVVERFARKD